MIFFLSRIFLTREVIPLLCKEKLFSNQSVSQKIGVNRNIFPTFQQKFEVYNKLFIISFCKKS